MRGMATPVEMVRWMLLGSEQWGQIIVLVVDDSRDDAISAAVATGSEVPSERFGGLWGTGERDGDWLFSFPLVEVGGDLASGG